MRNQKKQKIIRLLLQGGIRTKYALAKAAGASTAWVIELLQKLEKQGVTSGLHVIDQDGLIAAYLQTRRRQTSFAVYVENPEEFFRRAKQPYALTTYAAENLTTHTLFLSRWDAYIRPEDRETWLRAVRAQGLLGAGNIRFIIDDEEAIAERRRINDLQLVSEPLLLIDLKAEGGVCEEAYRRLSDVRRA